jgi:hypothetical protein
MVQNEPCSRANKVRAHGRQFSFLVNDDGHPRALLHRCGKPSVSDAALLPSIHGCQDLVNLSVSEMRWDSSPDLAHFS